MTIQFILKTQLGEFTSENLVITSEQYQNLLEISKDFYKGSYEMFLPQGFLVAPPEVLKHSILIIETIPDI